MDVEFALRIADVAAHQEARAAPADRIAAATARRRLEAFAILKLRQREDLAPALPGGGDLVAVCALAQGDVEGRIAVNEDQQLRLAGLTQRNAAKIADADVDGHAHAVDGTAEHDAFAMQFHLPHAAVRTGVVRIETDRQRKGVEPHAAARPGGIAPACCCLTPHGFSLPAGIMFPVDGVTLAAAFANSA